MAKVEKALMMGRGRWIADFNESFRNFKLQDIEFDIFIRGNTRVRGFLLSRLFSVTVNPNYSVGCFMISTESIGYFNKRLLVNALMRIQSYMKNNEMKWSWLFIFANKDNSEMRKQVESIKDQYIGVVLVDVRSGDVIHSNSYLGRQAKKYVKL